MASQWKKVRRVGQLKKPPYLILHRIKTNFCGGIVVYKTRLVFEFYTSVLHCFRTKALRSNIPKWLPKSIGLVLLSCPWSDQFSRIKLSRCHQTSAICVDWQMREFVSPVTRDSWEGGCWFWNVRWGHNCLKLSISDDNLFLLGFKSLPFFVAGPR